MTQFSCVLCHHFPAVPCDCCDAPLCSVCMHGHLQYDIALPLESDEPDDFEIE